MLKKCTVCLETKPVRSAFRTKDGGYHSWCRECEAEEKRAFRARSKAK